MYHRASRVLCALLELGRSPILELAMLLNIIFQGKIQRQLYLLSYRYPKIADYNEEGNRHVAFHARQLRVWKRRNPFLETLLIE
jgi:hypothetical protein